jgi:NTE family protein
VKSGLVLSGGGANGAYEVGVLKALLLGRSPATGHEPLLPDSIASTSIGSFNAAVLLSHSYSRGWHDGIAALESIWTDQMAAPRAMSEFVTGSGGVAHRVTELFDISTFLTPEPSEELVRSTVFPARIRDSSVALRVTATQWEKGTLRVFSNTEFSDEIGTSIVRASGAIPGLFPPVAIGGDLFVDGGVVLNTPLKPAIEAGADVLHVIYLDPELGSVPLRRVGSTVDAMGRLFIASFAATMRRDLAVATSINDDVAAGLRPQRRLITIHLYHPQEDTGGALGMLDFDRDRVVALAALGYKDAIEHDCTTAGCLNVPTPLPIGD